MKKIMPAPKNIVFMFLVMLSFTADAAGLFLRGSSSVSLVIGSGRALNETYTVFGAGVNYFVLDGLSLGVEGEKWTGGTLSIEKYSPQVQYVFDVSGSHPYLGAFFRRARIETLPDQDAIGYRAGLYLDTSSNVYISAGVVYEKYQDCNRAVFVSCSETYPELTLSFAL